MIVFENSTWQSSSQYPDGNFLEGLDCEQPKWVIPDGSDLANKIISVPCWKAVEDGEGNLTDIIPINGLDTANEENKLKEQLEQLDKQAIRPLRAIAAGTATDEDRALLAELENRAEEIRAELAALKGDNENEKAPRQVENDAGTEQEKTEEGNG